MDPIDVDQNEFLKDVRERAKVLSKNARQAPADSVEKIARFEEEDEETKDFLAIIRGTDQGPSDDMSALKKEDAIDLDFASNLANNRPLDFSRERFKAGLAQRRVQKRRRPQSWAWTATSDSSSVKITEVKGSTEGAISLQIEMDDDSPKVDDSPKAIENPKVHRPQNRFSSPVFNDKLMSDLGNVLKKKTSPRKTEKESPRDGSASPRQFKKPTAAPPKLPVASPSLSPRAGSPSQQRLTVGRSPSPEDISLVLVTEREVFGSQTSPFLVRRSAGDVSKKPNVFDKSVMSDDDDAEMSSTSSRSLSSAAMENSKATPAPLSSNTFKVQSGYINEHVKLNVGPKAPLPKPKPKPQQSSAMLLKNAAQANQSKVAKEEVRDAVKAKPSWLEELEKKKSKEPLKAARAEDTELGSKSGDTESSNGKSLPAWMQQEISSRQKRQETAKSSGDSSVMKPSSVEKKPQVEEKQPSGWLQELQLKKQRRGLKKEEDPVRSECKDSGIKGSFDYRSHEQLKKAEMKDKDKSSGEDDERLKSVSELKKKLSMKGDKGKKTPTNSDPKTDCVDGFLKNQNKKTEGSTAPQKKKPDFRVEARSEISSSSGLDGPYVEAFQSDQQMTSDLGNVREQTVEEKDVSLESHGLRNVEIEIVDVAMEVKSTEKFDSFRKSQETSSCETSVSVLSSSTDSATLDELDLGGQIKKDDQIQSELKSDKDAIGLKEEPTRAFGKKVKMELSQEALHSDFDAVDKSVMDPSEKTKPEMEASFPLLPPISTKRDKEREDDTDGSHAPKPVGVALVPLASKDEPVLKKKVIPKVPSRPKVLPKLKPRPKPFVDEAREQKSKPDVSQTHFSLQQKHPKDSATSTNAGTRQSDASNQDDHPSGVKDSSSGDSEDPTMNRTSIDLKEVDSSTMVAELSTNKKVVDLDVNMRSCTEEMIVQEAVVPSRVSNVAGGNQVDAEMTDISATSDKSGADNDKSELKDDSNTDDEKLPKRLRAKLVRVGSFEHGVLSRPIIDVKGDKPAKVSEVEHKGKDSNQGDEIGSTGAEKVSQPQNWQSSSPKIDKINRVAKSDSFKENDNVNNRTKLENASQIVEEETSRDVIEKDVGVKTIEPESKADSSVKVGIDLLSKSRKPPPPKPKPKPRVSAKPDALKGKNNEKTSDNRLFTANENLRNIEKSKNLTEIDTSRTETTTPQTENKDLTPSSSQLEKVKLRAKNPVRVNQRRPVSMIESTSSATSNESTSKAPGSGTKFAAVLEKKQKSCWFRGAFDTNDLKPLDETDDIPAWKKQLLARLKSDNRNEKPSSDKEKIKTTANVDTPKESGNFRSRLVTSPDFLNKKEKDFGIKKTVNENDVLAPEENQSQSTPAFIQEFAARRQSRGQKGNPDQNQTFASSKKEQTTDSEAWV